MGKSLIITEKPSVARDIVAALDSLQEHEGYWENDRYVVSFTVGHLVELLEPEDLDPIHKRWVLDQLPILPTEFRLKPKSGTRDRLRVLRALLGRKDVVEVVNACDAGREGELIFREIMEFLGSQKPVKRLWLQSMTQSAIRAGFENLAPGEQYDGLASAAACRSHSDWLIGMNATRALTKRLKGRREKTAWSAGRVQTPTLTMLVDRELEVLAHVPRAYWRIAAVFQAIGHTYSALWFDPSFRAPKDDPDVRDDRIFDEERAQEIAEAVRGRPGLARETRKPSRENAPPLFDLTSLQRECNQRYGWSARRTLNAAQRCYEGHKVLTYPRTDSRCLPSDYRATVDQLISAFAQGKDYGPWAKHLQKEGLRNVKRTFDDARVTDHFAIIPTGVLPRSPLSGDDGRLFDLVVRRFLATFFPEAVWTRVERITESAGHHFRARARTLDEPGWRAVLGQTEQEDQPLPPLRVGQEAAEGVDVRNLDVEVKGEQTKPPPRITEARLLTLMETAGRYVEDEELAAALHEKGIGTAATRADIIENLIAKGYVLRQGKSLRPTVKGVRLVDVLRRIQADRLASPELTGEMEFRLREVEHGTRSAPEFMKEIAEYTTHIVDRARDFNYDDLYPDEEPLGTCPCEQRRPVFERAWFYRCPEDPAAEPDEDCPFRIWKDKAGRYIDRGTVRLLLEKGETPVLEGFLTRDGRTYQGILKLEGRELKLVPVSDGIEERVVADPEYEVDEQPLGPCPTGDGGTIVETPTHYVCSLQSPKTEGEEGCRFTLPRTVCKREITREEAEAYVRDKRTEMLSDFTSRNGRPFPAILYLKPNGRHGFEFAPRSPKKGKRGGAKAPGKKTGAKGGRKKAGGKKTTRKKGARKAGTRSTSTRERSAGPSRKGAALSARAGAEQTEED